MSVTVTELAPTQVIVEDVSGTVEVVASPLHDVTVVTEGGPQGPIGLPGTGILPTTEEKMILAQATDLKDKYVETYHPTGQLDLVTYPDDADYTSTSVTYGVNVNEQYTTQLLTFIFESEAWVYEIEHLWNEVGSLWVRDGGTGIWTYTVAPLSTVEGYAGYRILTFTRT